MPTRELCDAATANFIVHASWASRRIPGALVASTPSLTMVDSGLDTDTFNLVCGARLREGELAENAVRVRTHVGRRGRPFSWWVAPGDAPGDLAARLKEAGLEEKETEVAMALRISDATPRRGAPEDVEIGRPRRTRAAHRRRHRQRAARTCVPASRRGRAGTVVLQASAAGGSLYRSYGFHEFGLIGELKPAHS